MSSKWLLVPDGGSAECNNVTGVFLNADRGTAHRQAAGRNETGQHKLLTALIHRNTPNNAVFFILFHIELGHSNWAKRSELCSPGD